MSVKLIEEGVWEPETWSIHAGHDEWKQIGWKVVTSEGLILFEHEDEELVKQWLTDNGYTSCDDGTHFEQKQ